MRRPALLLACWVLALAAIGPGAAAEAVPATVHALKITLLSTMLADRNELGEWGFAALVEADGRRILFDTGAHPDLVLKNAEAMGIDLSSVPELVLSHSHSDHVGGLITLRRVEMARATSALGRAHVGLGIFYPRHSLSRGIDENPMNLYRPEYERMGGVFIVHDRPAEIHPGVWVTGPVPRRYPEQNWAAGTWVETPRGLMADDLPEDMAMIFNTGQGLIVLTGCGHAGVINTIAYARAFLRPARVHALVGGLHLFNASDDTLSWTAARLREFGVDWLLGAHCTGIETVFRLRRDLGLDRARAVVGAVGSTFELGRGIDPGVIAR